MRNKILDIILTTLMALETDSFKGRIPKEISIDFFELAYPNYDWDDWIKESYVSELKYKEFIVLDKKGNISITEKGREFKRKGGYDKIDKVTKQEDDIREKTIEGFKYGKWGFYISIIAITISIITLIWKG